MRKLLAFLIVIALCSCGNNKTKIANDKAAEMTNGATIAPAAETSSGYKKYDIKSGIITYETKMAMGGVNINTRKILYFDDFGNKESEEEYKTNAATGKEEFSSRDFVKDGFRYTCSVENKSGAKTKAMGYGVAAKFDMDEAATLKDNKFTKVGDETVCGKPCSGFSMVTPSGNITMYGWNHIALKTTVNNAAMKMKSETVATKIEENVSIPSDRFEVPKDVTMTAM